MMGVLVTNAVIRRVKLQSNRHHQHTAIQSFHMPDALPVAQPRTTALKGHHFYPIILSHLSKK